MSLFELKCAFTRYVMGVLSEGKGRQEVFHKKLRNPLVGDNLLKVVLRQLKYSFVQWTLIIQKL